MKQRAIFKQVPRIGIKTFMLVLLSMALILCDTRGSWTKSLRYYLNTAIAPLQYLVAYPHWLSSKIKTSVQKQQALIQANEQLNKRLLDINVRLEKLLFLEKENQLLRQMLDAKRALPDAIRVKVAEVMSISTDVQHNELVLADGAHDQVSLGQPALDAYGVLGQVIDLGENTSRLMLLTDTRSAIPVVNNRTGYSAILAGGGLGNPLYLMHVPKTEAMQVGDLLVTSGQGKRFPQGYPVGKIIALDQSANTTFSVIKVAPSAHFARSHFVLLVWPEAQPSAVKNATSSSNLFNSGDSLT